MRYEHTQIGHVIIWSLLALILIATCAVIGIIAPLRAAIGRFNYPAGLPRFVL
jgi:hypothetical protein